MTGPVLAVRDLVVEFDTPEGTLRAVDGVSFDLAPGETLGVVGESGCGKTVTALAVLGLLPRPPGRIARGRILLEGRDLLGLSSRQLRQVRGKQVAMVFQDPMTSLHPAFTVGHQVAEALRAHDPRLPAAAARARAAELLDLAGVPRARSRVGDYPHEWSGGMRQRAMIAMAIANRPKVLIADEPTTALDVTIQAQVLEVLGVVRQQTGAGMVLITHDLGVIAETADRVAVMYAGRIVEVGDVETVFRAPCHPYTLGLMASLPRPDTDLRRLASIPGQPPSLVSPPPGCAFHPRCRLRQGRDRCVRECPPLAPVGGGHRSACHFADEMGSEIRKVAAEMGVDPTAEAR